MTAWVYTLLIVYVIGFACVLVLNLLIGPVTPGLALLRALVWFIWIFTGIPEGVRHSGISDLE